MTSQDYMASSRVVPRFLVLGIFVLFCSICRADAQAYQRAQKPHIIMIVADDLGWDDVSFHGSPQIPTPTLDGLAESGVILNNYYVSPMDSPTRAAFMTGKYALNLGLQHDTIHNKQPFGLPLKEKLLPEYLRQMGYSTHAVGKWQLGFFAKEFTPTYRGFDSFYGFWTSGQDYFSHVTYDGSYGLDLRRDLAVVYNETGTYGTELFTREADKVINHHDDSKPLFLYFAHQAVHVGNDNEPLQVPKKYLDRLSYIGDEKRRTYAGMVSALDESVRQIVTTLKRKGLYDNSIIIFTTDNGAAAGGLDSSAGSNFPLRGAKNTLWEGGVRGVGFVHSPLIKKRGRVSTALLHASDWFPTFYTLAGGNVKSLGAIDGFNVWDTISNDAQSPRYEILHGLDSLKEKKAAIRIGDYKMIVHQNRSFYSDWYPRPESLHELDQVPKPSLLKDASVDCTVRHPHPLLYTKAPICNPEKKPCLFNIKWDPCEYHNLADFMPNTLKVMIDRLKFYARKSAPAVYPQADESANPDQHGGVWTPWREKTDVDQTMNDYVYPYSYYDSPKPKPSGPPKNQLDQFMRDQGLASSDKANTYPEVEDIIINFREHNVTEGSNKEAIATLANTETTPTTASTASMAPPAVIMASTASTAAFINTAPPPASIAPAIASRVSPKLDYAAQRPKPFRPTGFLKGFFQHQLAHTTMTPGGANRIADTVKQVEQIVAKTPKYVNPLTMRPTDKMPAIHAWPTEQSLIPNDVQSVIRHNGFTKHLASSHVEEVSMLPPVKSPETLAHKPAMFSSHTHKGDTLPEILDIIDEPAVPNAYAAGGSGQEETIPKIFDIIDEAHKQGSQVKELSSQQQGPIATSKPLTSNDVGSGMGVGLTGLPDGISVFGKLGDQKILSKSHETGEGREHIVAKEKPSKGKKKANVHKFIGNITIDGRRYLVVGTETEESDSVSSHMEGNTITLHLPKSKKPHSHDEKSKGKDKSAEDADSKSEIGGFRAPSEPGIGEITDYIDDDELGTEKPTNKTLAAHNITAVATTGNNTKCEKVVQLDTSDNAVVVSSVVIVVIASAMVVGVAVVAMVAVVARHCQNARN